VIHIHGTAHHNISYDGGRGDGYAHIEGPAVPGVIAAWRTTGRCGAARDTTLGAVTTSVTDCAEGRAAELVTVAGAGHRWPGSPSRPLIQRALGLDPPSTALDATTTIWAFLAAGPAPA
jgi:polyhydroxybutyrate depolymerase